MTTENAIHFTSEYKHVNDMEWEMGRFKNKTKFLFHPDPGRPSRARKSYNMSLAQAFRFTSTTSLKSGIGAGLS
jgi:hypothetical protein